MYPVFFITCGENCFTSYNPWEPFDMRTRTRMIAANFAISHDLKVGVILSKQSGEISLE